MRSRIKFKIAISLILIIFSLSFPHMVHAFDGDVYVLNGTNREAVSATINNISINASTADSINNSVASMTPMVTEIYSQSPTGSYDVDITVNASNTRPIHPLFFGFNLQGYLNLGYTDASMTQRLRDPRLSTLVGKFRPGLVRYPGGTFGLVRWDRTNTISPTDTRGWGGQTTVIRAQDLDDLVAFCRNSGATLFIQIPLTPGYENNWADFAAYCNEKGYGSDVVYLSCGNENDTSGLDGSFPAWTADEYATNYESYYDAMKAVKPDLIFTAPESCKATYDIVHTEWISPILARLAMDSYDVGILCSHIYHFYDSNGNTVDNLLSNLDIFTQTTQELVALRDQGCPGTPIMWTEIGPSCGVPPDYIFHGLCTALWFAEVMGRIARAGGDGVQWYYLCCDPGFVWPSSLFANDYSAIWPPTYTFLMFGQWWGDKWIMDVNSTVDSKLSVNASVDNDRVYVMMINKTASENLMARATINNVDGRDYYIEYNCPAHSITTVAFNKAEPVPEKLIVTADPSIIAADGISTSQITAKVCDNNGFLSKNSTALVTFSLSGNAGGTLIGTNPVNANGGITTITYRSGTVEGTATVTATSQNLTQDSVNINLVLNDAPNASMNLLCNSQVNPIGVADKTPDLSWTFSDPDTGDNQSAYRILVADSQNAINSNNGNMWDTGKSASGGSADNVTYAGQDLQLGTTHYWKVMVWDSFDVSGPYSQVATFKIAAGFALQFDGTDDYVDLGGDSILDINSGNATGITVEMWIKRTEMSREGHFFARYVWNQGGYEVWIDNSDHLHFRLAVPDNVIINASGYSLTSGEWYHIACQTDGTTGKIYIDGIDRTSGVDGTLGMPESIGINAYIGTDYVGGGHAGVVIDELRVSNTVRYTNDFTPLSAPFTPDSNTVGLWHFDEGTGSPGIGDASGNNINGILYNSPLWVRGFNVTDVIDDSPYILVSKTRLEFGEIEIGKTGTLDFVITNTGGGTLSGSISTDKKWIEVTPTSFVAAPFGNNVTVNVTVNNSILNQKEGEHTGTISITSNGGNTSVEVTLVATCVLAKPNPYNPEKGELTFFGDGIVPGVPGGTTIRIYTLSGELVKTLNNVGQGFNLANKIQWDGKNEEGKKVTSGIYIYIFESAKEKGVGKFTIIRK